MGQSSLTVLIEDASGSAVPVDELLRRLKVVASRARLPELDMWVQHELNGYPDGVPLPSYRGPFPTVVLGHLVGPFGREVRNAPIPPSAYPAELRDGHLWRVSLGSGVSELESLAARDEAVQLAWPPDMIPYTTYLQQRGECGIDPMMSLVGAKQVLDRSVIVGLLRAVRDRVLSLALRLEVENPKLGEPGEPPAAATVGRDVHVIVNGGSANVAVASTQFKQIHKAGQSDAAIEQLIKQVRAAGVTEDEAEDLRQALQEDVAAQTPDGILGEKTQGWLRRLSGKAGGAVATGTVGSVTKVLLEQGLGI